MTFSTNAYTMKFLSEKMRELAMKTLSSEYFIYIYLSIYAHIVVHIYWMSSSFWINAGGVCLQICITLVVNWIRTWIASLSIQFSFILLSSFYLSLLANTHGYINLSCCGINVMVTVRANVYFQFIYYFLHTVTASTYLYSSSTCCCCCCC